MRQKGKKVLSPKLLLKKVTWHIPEEIYEWLKEKSDREMKSMSYLVVEILKEAYEKEKNKG